MGDHWYPPCTANVHKLNRDFRQTKDDPKEPKASGDERGLADLETPSDKQKPRSHDEQTSPSPLRRKPTEDSPRPSLPSGTLNKSEDWARLPDPVLKTLFRFFSGQDLAACLGRVCRHWYRNAYSPGLWRRLDLRLSEATLGDEARLEYVRELLEAVQPSELSLCGTIQFAALPHQLLLPHLHRLHILDLGVSGGLGPLIVKSLIADPCPNLAHLNLIHCYALDDALLGLLCRAMPQLRTLSFCGQVSDEGLQRMAAALRGLDTLSIDRKELISDQGVRDLVHSQGHSLRRLYFHGGKLTDNAIAAIAEFCPRLRLFSISHAWNLTDESLVSLRALRELEHLHLRGGMGLTGTGLLELFLPPRGLKALRYVDLTGCSALKDDGVAALVGSDPDLVSLNLSLCGKVSELGFQHILQGLPELRFLSLSGLKKIIGVIPDGRLPLLQHLEVDLSVSNIWMIAEEWVMKPLHRIQLYLLSAGCYGVWDFEQMTLALVRAKRAGQQPPEPRTSLHELQSQGACCMVMP